MVKEKPQYTILLFYQYTYIADPKQLMLDQRAVGESLNLSGRIIVAHEGINATLEGRSEDTEKYIETLVQDPRFADIHFKKSAGTGMRLLNFPLRCVKKLLVCI